MIRITLSRINYQCAVFILLCFYCVQVAIAESAFADSHIHYNWDQAELISAEAVIDRLKANNTQLAVVSSTPTHLALELRRKAGQWIIPLFSPYTHELGKRDWFLDKSLVEKAERGLASKNYFGIGEIHFMAGFPPRSDNPNFLGLMGLAERFKVPVLIHVDAGDERFFLDLCRTHSRVRILFAHAGGNLSPSHVHKIMQSCKNVWVEFSAKDPWRYAGLVNDKHQLLAGWKKLVLTFPRRILTGTDPVWRVTRTQSWDQADDGWDHYQQLHQFHQQWIDSLPEQIQHFIRWQNAVELFGYQ